MATTSGATRMRFLSAPLRIVSYVFLLLALLLLVLAAILYFVVSSPSRVENLAQRYVPELELERLHYALPDVRFPQRNQIAIDFSLVQVTTSAINLDANHAEFAIQLWPPALQQVRMGALKLHVLEPKNTEPSSPADFAPYSQLESLRALPTLSIIAPDVYIQAKEFQAQLNVQWLHRALTLGAKALKSSKQEPNDQLSIEGQFKAKLNLAAQDGSSAGPVKDAVMEENIHLKLDSRWQASLINIAADLSVGSISKAKLQASSSGPWQFSLASTTDLKALYQFASPFHSLIPVSNLQLDGPLSLDASAQSDENLQLKKVEVNTQLDAPFGFTAEQVEGVGPIKIKAQLMEPLSLAWLAKESVIMSGGRLLIESDVGVSGEGPDEWPLRLMVDTPQACTVQQCEPQLQVTLAPIGLHKLPLLDEGLLGQVASLESFNSTAKIRWQGFENPVLVQGELELSLSELSYESYQLGQLILEPTVFSASLASLQSSPTVQLELPTLGLIAKRFQIDDKSLQIAEVNTQLNNVSASWDGSLSFAGAYQLSHGDVSWQRKSYPPVYLEGQARWQESHLKLSGRLNTSLAKPLLDFSLKQHLSASVAGASGVGGLGEAAVSLSDGLWQTKEPLSSWFESWPFSFDVVDGALGFEAQVNWRLDKLQAWSLIADIEAEKLSGVQGDIGFVGLSTQAKLAVNGEGELTAPNFSVELDSLDVGLPIDNISLELAVTKSGQYRLGNLQANLLDGDLSAKHWQLQGPVGALSSAEPMNIQLQGLRLKDLLDAAAYPGLDATATLSGRLPLSMEKGQPIIKDGSVYAIEPGVIRYEGLGGAGNQLMDLVSEALSNYHYQVLDSSLDYDETGYLQMAISMKGKNPDMNNGQQVNLNVNLSDNIPSLMKSLQAGRLITDAIGSKLLEQ